MSSRKVDGGKRGKLAKDLLRAASGEDHEQ